MSRWEPIRRDRCRVCRSPGPRPFLTLPKIPLPMGHVAPGREDTCFCEDLTLHVCGDCGVVQTMTDYDLGDYYSRYAYAASGSPLVRRFMELFADETWSRFGMRPGDRVLEIGSGDGFQLACYRNLGAKVLGIEPSRSLAARSRERRVETISTLFGPDTLRFLPDDFRRVHLLITQYTFDHLPEPMPFLKAVGDILDPDRGVLIIEVHDFHKIVERNEACLLVHEHAIYPSRDSMAVILERAGLRLIATDIVPEEERRGNSLIVAAAKPKDATAPDASSRRPGGVEAYAGFEEEVLRAHGRLAEHVRDLRARGKRVVGYGAAGRGVNTLAIAGLTREDIAYVCDMNEKLHGLLMPVSFIPVASPERLLNDQVVDEVIVFNYGYMREIEDTLRPLIHRGCRVVSMLEYLRGSGEA